MESDPFIGFISDLSEKIRLEREHKKIMERVSSEETTNESKASLENVINAIKIKIQESSNNALTETIPLTSNIIKKVTEEENNFTDFVSKLKNILENKPQAKEPAVPAEAKLDEPNDNPTLTHSNTKIDYKDEILKSSQFKKKNLNTNKEKTKTYVKELENIKNSVAVEKEDNKVSEIKKLIEEYAEKYIKKAIVMSEYAGGGGTNAVQYANGGVMNGDLYVNNIFPNNSTGTIGTSSNRWDTFYVNNIDALSANIVFELSGFYVDGDFTVNGTISATNLTVTQNLSVGGTVYSSKTALAVVEYNTLIGDGVNNSFTINHSLNTSAIQISVYDQATNVLSYPSIQIASLNTVNIFFDFIPSVNSYRVLIVGSKPTNEINAYGNTVYIAASGLGDIPILSSTWVSTYETVYALSASWNSGGSVVPCNKDFYSWASYSNWINGVDGYYKFNVLLSNPSLYLKFHFLGGSVNGKPISLCNPVVSSFIDVNGSNLYYRNDGYGLAPANYVDFVNSIFNSLSLYTRLSATGVGKFRANYCYLDQFNLIFREITNIYEQPLTTRYWTILTRPDYPYRIWDSIDYAYNSSYATWTPVNSPF